MAEAGLCQCDSIVKNETLCVCVTLALFQGFGSHPEVKSKLTWRG